LQKVVAALLLLLRDVEIAADGRRAGAVSKRGAARRLIVYCDGASRGNPGPAGAAAVILDGRGAVVDKVAAHVGSTTNNVAEYHGALLGVERAAALGATRLSIRSDSELLVKQIRGEYRVKNPKLKPLHERLMRLLERFDEVDAAHVPREENTRADALADRAIDERPAKP
jgi:ribonuclease HI